MLHFSEWKSLSIDSISLSWGEFLGYIWFKGFKLGIHSYFTISCYKYWYPCKCPWIIVFKLFGLPMSEFLSGANLRVIVYKKDMGIRNQKLM